MSLKLYDLTGAYKQLQAMIDEGTDEALIAALEQVEGAITEKAGSIAKFIKSLEYDVDVIKQEETRLKNIRTARENKIKSLKFYLQSQMEKAAIETINSPTLPVKLLINGNPSLNIIEPKKVPAKFLTIVPASKVPDKKAIIEYLKTTKKKVKWAELNYGKHIKIG